MENFKISIDVKQISSYAIMPSKLLTQKLSQGEYDALLAITSFREINKRNEHFRFNINLYAKAFKKDQRTINKGFESLVERKIVIINNDEITLNYELIESYDTIYKESLSIMNETKKQLKKENEELTKKNELKDELIKAYEEGNIELAKSIKAKIAALESNTATIINQSKEDTTEEKIIEKTPSIEELETSFYNQPTEEVKTEFKPVLDIIKDEDDEVIEEEEIIENTASNEVTNDKIKVLKSKENTEEFFDFLNNDFSIFDNIKAI